jgi:hypothetical protein
MRNIVIAAIIVVAAVAALAGLRWAGLLSHEAMVVGFATGIAVAAVLSFAKKRAT